ncbi:hypothetical protein FB451DRAFT_1493071 [Mycena latifolia]|nr:hypothetical protein FB451DRAFT_1493071 [Mycena latifolia]
MLPGVRDDYLSISGADGSWKSTSGHKNIAHISTRRSSIATYAPSRAPASLACTAARISPGPPSSTRSWTSSSGALEVGTDIAKAVANRISRRLIANLALIRGARTATTMTSASRTSSCGTSRTTRNPSSSTLVYRVGFDEAVEMRKVLTTAENGGWHVASPYKQCIYDRYAAIFRPQHVNAEVESLPDEVREEQFERVPGTGGPDARDRVVQWRVRSGVCTQDDFLERQPIPESEREDGEDNGT